MKKVFMSIGRCKEGMKIAETVLNDFGGIIISEGMIIEKNVIEKLKELGINSIKVYEPPQKGNSIIEESKVFEYHYNKNVNMIKGILNDISKGKNVNMKKINNISDSIIDKVNSKGTIISCISKIQSADSYTYTHSMNVALLCMLLAKWLRYSPETIKNIVTAALLHDIGKTKIPLEILNKKESLSEQEFEEVKKHSVYGYRIAQEMPDICDDVLKGILMHHEREDGSGYPIGMKGDKIHEFSKIIAVADIYDAMTSERVYRHRQSPFEVFDILEHKSFGILDTKVLNAFLNNIANYYIGEKVKLNTGEVAEIIYINPRNISQPVVRNGNKYIDITAEPGIKIEELL